MAEKATISAAFYMQLATIATIVVSSIIGFNFGINKMEEIAAAKLKPLIDRIERVEARQDEQDALIAASTNRTQANYICINNFLEYYNTAFHKEFLRPVDLEEQTDKRRR